MVAYRDKGESVQSPSPIGIGNGPGHPHAVPAPHEPAQVFAPPGIKNVKPVAVPADPLAQYRSEVAKNLQYLTPQQRTEAQQRQGEFNNTVAQATAQKNKLQSFMSLRTKGAQGIRAQQATLRQNGYNISVDGVYGNQTEGALKDYIAKQSSQLNTQVQSKAAWAHPLNIRAEANAKFSPKQVTNNRNFILGYVTQQQSKYRAALVQAQNEARMGKQGAKDQVKSIQQAIAGLDGLRAKAMDPVNGLDPTDLAHTMRNLTLQEQNTLQQENIDAASQANNLVSVLEQSFFQTLDKATLNIANRGSGAFAAAFETGLRTGNYGKAIESFVGGFSSFIRVPWTDISLVGVIAPGGSDARKYIEATNTSKEQQDLVARGDLLSLGQTLTGTETPQFKEKHPLGIGNAGSLIDSIVNPGSVDKADRVAQENVRIAHGFDWLSAAADFGTTPIKDPTLIGGLALEGLGEFGNVDRQLSKVPQEVIDRFGEDGTARLIRATRIGNTVTGRALMTNVGDAVERSVSAADLRKAIPGLDQASALAAMAAKESEDGGVEAAKNIVKNAFIDHTWNPKISAVKQLTNNLGERIGLIGAEGEGRIPGLAGANIDGAVKAGDRLAAIRVVAEPKDPIASSFERNAVAFTDQAVKTAADTAGSTVNKLWTDLVSSSVRGVDSIDRVWNAMAEIGKLDNPQLQAAMDGYLRPFLANPEALQSVPLGTYMEALVNQDGFEAALQKVELASAIAHGDAGDAALKQFNADVTGFLPSATPVKEAFQTAVQNVGLKLGKATQKATRRDITDAISKLPVEDRQFFQDRLDALAGKKGLGRLATDVKLAAENPDLRDELQRILDENVARADQYAERNTGRAGLARKVRQLPTKLVLSNTDVVPPTELAYKGGTANELYHTALRAKAATRYLDAFYVPAIVKANLVRAMETVQTEEEFFGVVERMTRAAMEAKGVENPDAVLAILKSRGDFFRVLTKPVRTVIDGEPIEDLQTLAQRAETARLPTPAAVAAAVRKSVIEGTEDASTARRLAAQLRTEVSKVGDISLHLTNLKGETLTITSGAKAFHRLWKFLIVTNAGMPVLGAAAGFIGTQGSISDRLHNAGLGFAIGAAGSVRYIGRVAGIEDRVRMLLDQGFTSDMHMPGWSKLQARRYSEDVFRRTLSDDLIRVGNYGTSHFDNELLTHIDPDWIVLDKDHPRAVDAWYRIINHQVHPESDPVMAILLREQAGHLGGEENITRVVRVGPELKTPTNLFAEAFGTAGAAEDTRSEFQKQMDDLARQVTDSGVAPVRATNEDLLADFGGSDKRTFYRGEDAAYPNRGDHWIPEDYNKGQGEKYARNFAGEDGHVFKVELPVDEHGVPLVGEVAGEGNMGWVLAGEDARWADASTEMLPNGLAATAADVASYKTVTEKVTLSARDDAERQIAAFLETDEGQLWKERWKGAMGGTGSPKKAVERMREFLDRYSTPELANLRVAGGVNGIPGEIEHDTLKRLLKTGLGPDSFHAQQAWKMPTNAKQLFQAAGRIESKLVLTGPTETLNRGPMFRSLFYKEYDRMVMNGVDHELAQSIADMSAADHVNSIMHRFEEQSRFAAKVDFYLPFQHAREDIFRVYGKLLLEHPVDTMRVVSHAAMLFNDGKQLGVFTKNEFTGQWEMTVPGSGRLSHSLFKMPFDSTFTANIKDMLFVANGAYGVGFLPQPGGPFWSLASRLLAEAKPSLFTGKYPLHNWLWGYGPQGNLLRKDTSRLWMAFTGETPPWELASQADWKNQHNRWQTEVAQELIYQHRKDNPTDTSWFPSQDDLDEATKNFYEAWAFVGSTFPASTYPTLTGESKYWAARNAFTVGGVLPFDPTAFLKKYPEFEPFTVGTNSKYVGPDDLATIKRLNVGGSNGLSTFNPDTGQWEQNTSKGAGEDYTTESALGYRQYRSFSKFKDDFKFYKREGEYFRKLTDARALQKKDPFGAEQMLTSLAKSYADVVTKTRRTYDITVDLYNVTWMYPKALRAQAIARIKNQWGLSNVDLQYFQGKANNPEFLPNAWREARLGSDVAAEVQQRFGNTVTGGTPGGDVLKYAALPQNGKVEQYIATLNPAEQANYWKYEIAALGYDPQLDSPTSVLAKDAYFKKQLSAVFNEYPFLLNSNKRRDNWENPFTTEVNNLTSGINSQASATYTQIDQIQSEMQNAVQSKNWKAYYALKSQRDSLYDIADALHNKLRNNLPDLTQYYADMHSAALEGAAGNATEEEHYLHQAAMDKAKAPYYLIAEQRRYLNYPPAVQRAYMASLVQGLDMPSGKSPYDVSQYVKNETGLKKLFWDYLTPTQQDLLRANFPQYVDRWMYQSETTLGPTQGKGKMPAALKWAYEQLNKYTKRGDMAKPASYSQYLALPANLAAREQFLNAHPDVRTYLNAGPFAHMPPALRDQVSSVLNKFGNYRPSRGYNGKSGTHIKNRGLGYEGNVNVAWAKEQLYIWSRRKNPDGSYQQKPAEYDQWVNMPTGVDKANFLKSHPDLENWIKLGPMANMPDEYKAVVRDIMTRYGEWTQKDDPLGQTITQFFATPGYARDAFLSKHPELQAYWAATRSDADNAMFDLQNQYFNIQDVAAKRAFLASHPELQQHFIDARTKRYEAFLNQVAVFMGANPSMFTQYLTRQTDIMAELLRKFAEPVVIREAPPSFVSTADTAGSRTRQAERPPRNRNVAA